MKLIIDTQFVVKQAVVAAQVCGLLVKAGFNRIFRTQIITTTNVDVRGFTNVCEFEGIPSVQPGYVLVATRQTCNGYTKDRSSVRMTTSEWANLCKRAAFGESSSTFNR
ncbi:hypothetical protein [Pseudomonas syringae]|uniref:hypothetical protein n=1 Tax=Pseudomonas TaxID=286 RepID=UPI000373C2F2|nr:hypothetical protein [Pseudomonas syringae]